MPAAALATLIPAAIQLFTSLSQNAKANKLGSQYDRPNFQIPQGMLDALDMQKNLALQTGLPRQDLIEQKLDESSANALEGIKSAATSPWDIIKGSQRIGEAGAEKIKDLGISGAEFNRQSVMDYSGLLQGLSQLQEKQFMYNEFQPYMNAMNTIRGLREASTQNLYSGVSNATGVMSYNPDMFKDIFSGSGVGESKENLDLLSKFTESQMKYTAPPAN